MSGADAFINLVQLAVCAAYFAISIRLLRLSLQGGQTPERLLGLMFLFWGLSYVLYYPPFYFFAEGSSLQLAFFFASGIADSSGAFMLALVTRCVFRRHERWAKCLVGVIAFGLIAGHGGSLWLGDLEGKSPLSNPWYWFDIFGDTAAVIWIAIEGLQQYRKARQRRALGLCDPLVCNRYLLWGLSGVVWIAYNVALVAEYVDYEINQQWSQSLDLLVSSLGAIAVGVIWFMFFPPARYQHWIRGTDPATTAVGG